MSAIKKFEKPIGMRDTFPGIYEKIERAKRIGREVFRSRGFDFIETPTLEYYDTVGKASAISDASLFKLVDSQGNTLVLRPDMTTPITRVATSKLLKEKIPLRLAYAANVFRAQQMEGGRPAEFGQMGIEIIGDKTVFADAEVLITAIELMKEFGIESFKLTIGHAGVLHDILNDYTDHEEQREILRTLLVERNYVGFEEAVHEFGLPATKANALLEFISEATNLASIEDMEKYVRKNDGIEYMKQLSKLINAYGLSQYVSFDFTLSSHMNYYTGMLFEIFASGSGFPLGNGGRYDGLLHLFGSDVGATGFSIRIDRLLEVLPKEELKEETVCVLFDDEDFIKALELASTLRRQGARVTVQSKRGLINKEAFTKLFSRVVDLSQEETQ
ncbi:ATP phosphoribosyltransferase regulatory subunit [Ureibacillus sp. FSL K6-8385]|uniref:ATP phosphoribosyltransferase regulatory subunit n=1 Tax=Ureibacillus terrenus TaxID=118246 RepID=A0A540V1Y0_9BACL|nr:ATP phosphoribosyltransferase regulatory subunit [Ureibacillus terrenus]MED3661026.1 ATP phosphoribosyltransferase regulatory subunit [Ureibacillus terrenus]MED3763312.1 ATP phosphoribosyltransferase regulatory subunit [Ureibacillus terrenus]TQE90728.1 ATP phosphoribosyltransferase regulatory subunit [Ureibacillus terrenus]